MSLCVYRNNYLDIYQRRYVSISSPAKHVTRKKIASEQGTVSVGERKTCARMVAHGTDICIFILRREFEHILVHLLCKGTWVEEALCCPSCIPKCSLYSSGVAQVDEQQLFVLYAWQNTLWLRKSPWPVAPSETVWSWSTPATAVSLELFEE